MNINYVDSRTPEERELDSKIKTTVTTAGSLPHDEVITMTYTEKRLEEFDERLKEFVPTNTEQDIYLLAEDFKSFLSTSISQAIAEERERVVEAMMMKGIEAKMTPFQTTVNQYLRNRAEEIGIDLSLDKPLTDKE